MFRLLKHRSSRCLERPMASQQQEGQKMGPLKILMDKESKKVVALEATKDFVDTLFSFLSLPLGTIVRLLAATNIDDNEEHLSDSSFLSSINNLYQSIQDLNPKDFWNPICKQMLLNPKNPCEALCLKLFLNVDDTEPATRLLVCDSCNKFTIFSQLNCTCGKSMNRRPVNLDSKGQDNNAKAKGGVFVKGNGTIFLVFDDLKIVPKSSVTSMQLLRQLGYSELTQLQEVTWNFGKQEMLNLLKCTLTSQEPLTDIILGRSSKKTVNNQLNQFASAVRVKPNNNDKKIDIKLVRSKSQKKIIFAEANEDFIDFLFSFLTIPLGSIVKLLGGNSSMGCLDNLYKSVETLDSSWCTNSRYVLLNPGLASQFSLRKQPLSYYHGKGTPKKIYDFFRGSKSCESRSPYELKAADIKGFVKRPALYVVGDDLKVKRLTSCISYLKELNFPLDDFEVKVLSIGEAEALSLLGASLTSKSTLTSGLEDFLNVPKQESNLTSKCIQTSRLDVLLSKEPKSEA